MPNTPKITWFYGFKNDLYKTFSSCHTCCMYARILVLCNIYNEFYYSFQWYNFSLNNFIHENISYVHRLHNFLFGHVEKWFWFGRKWLKYMFILEFCILVITYKLQKGVKDFLVEKMSFFKNKLFKVLLMLLWLWYLQLCIWAKHSNPFFQEFLVTAFWSVVEVKSNHPNLLNNILDICNYSSVLDSK